ALAPRPNARSLAADLCSRPPRKLALPRRSAGGRHLPPAADRARRHADAVVLRPARPEVPHRGAAVAAGAVRAQPVAAQDARGAGCDSRAPDRGHAPRVPRRLRLEPRGWLLLPARWPDHPQAAL